MDFSNSSFTDSVFVANVAQNGGGLYASADDSPYITNCTFAENYAFLDGGGIALGENTTSHVFNCKIL
jgi:predicted outer membrane repeat protein